MANNHSYRERGNPLPPHGLLFPISSKFFFLYASSHRQENTYHGLCYTSREGIDSLLVWITGKVGKNIELLF